MMLSLSPFSDQNLLLAADRIKILFDGTGRLIKLVEYLVVGSKAITPTCKVDKIQPN